MKKIKSFLTVFLSVLLLVNATSFNLVNANDGDTSDVSQEGQNVEGETEEIKTYEVHYVAIAAYYVDQFDVPEEVVELMPADHTAITNGVVNQINESPLISGQLFLCATRSSTKKHQ